MQAFLAIGSSMYNAEHAKQVCSYIGFMQQFLLLQHRGHPVARSIDSTVMVRQMLQLQKAWVRLEGAC